MGILPSAARGTGPADHWRGNDVPALAQERPLGHGVALWQELMASTSTPVNLLADLHAIELQRITLNMQISLLHTSGRPRSASKAAEAEDAILRRLASIPPECAIGDRVGHPARARRRHGTGISTTTRLHHEYAFSGEGNIASPPSTGSSPTATTNRGACCG